LEDADLLASAEQEELVGRALRLRSEPRPSLMGGESTVNVGAVV
jgi:hypothetical protein